MPVYACVVRLLSLLCIHSCSEERQVDHCPAAAGGSDVLLGTRTIIVRKRVLGFICDCLVVAWRRAGDHPEAWTRLVSFAWCLGSVLLCVRWQVSRAGAACRARIPWAGQAARPTFRRVCDQRVFRCQSSQRERRLLRGRQICGTRPKPSP